MSAKVPSNEAEIRALVTRLSRPHRGGGAVIERAAILAEGGDTRAIFDWITDHAGVPEAAAPAKPAKGLYGTGFGGGDTPARGPARYVLPAGTLALTRRS